MTGAGFRVARVAPLLGRYLVVGDERIGAPLVLVIGYNVWQRRFAGDRDVIAARGSPRRSGVHDRWCDASRLHLPAESRDLDSFRANPNAYGRREGPWMYAFGGWRMA